MSTSPEAARLAPDFVQWLRCPLTGDRLQLRDGFLVTQDGSRSYRVSPAGIPLFAEQVCSPEGQEQQRHYDKVSRDYLTNLGYPHTIEYMKYLDAVLLQECGDQSLGTVAEICCGHGEALHLLADRIEVGIGLDVSLQMLNAARATLSSDHMHFIQGDATATPLPDALFDNVVMFGGIHHVSDRSRLFSEVFRLLKPGGRFVWREPVSDFFLWRWLRAIIYYLSPNLDHTNERPLLYQETVPPLEKAGFRLQSWRTCGLFGFCFFMNSDVLVFNRLFRFIPGIRRMTRISAQLDEGLVRFPGLRRAGLQVVGIAVKPHRAA